MLKCNLDFCFKTTIIDNNNEYNSNYKSHSSLNNLSSGEINVNSLNIELNELKDKNKGLELKVAKLEGVIEEHLRTKG